MISRRLEPLEQSITLVSLLEVERDGAIVEERDEKTFVIRELSIRGAAQFVRLLDCAVKIEASAVPSDQWETHLWEKVAPAIRPLLRFVLGQPVDGSTLTDEWLDGVPLSERERILEIQSELNRMTSVLPKLMAILEQSHAIRMAKLLLSYEEKTSGTGRGGRFATSSEPATESLPDASMPNGPSDRPGGVTDSPSELSGESMSSGSSSQEPSPPASPPGDSLAPTS